MPRIIGHMDTQCMDKQLFLLRRRSREERNAALRARLRGMTAEDALARLEALPAIGGENAPAAAQKTLNFA